jgi:hypothetical protein
MSSFTTVTGIVVTLSSSKKAENKPIDDHEGTEKTSGPEKAFGIY